MGFQCFLYHRNVLHYYYYYFAVLYGLNCEVNIVFGHFNLTISAILPRLIPISFINEQQMQVTH